MLEGEPKDIILWGSKGHALVLASAIRLLGGRVIALIDNDDTATSCLPDVPLFIGDAGLQKAVKGLDVGKVGGLVAIGGNGGRARINISTLFASVGIAPVTLIHPGAFVCPTAVVGKGSQILANAVVAASARLGAQCIVNHGGIVDHETELGDGCHIAPGAVLCGCVSAGPNVFVGARSVVLPRLKLGENCVIGAGSVVTRPVDAGSVVAGNPARVFESKVLPDVLVG